MRSEAMAALFQEGRKGVVETSETSGRQSELTSYLNSK